MFNLLLNDLHYFRFTYIINFISDSVVFIENSLLKLLISDVIAIVCDVLLNL